MNHNVMYPHLYVPATMDPAKTASLANGENDYVRRMVICTEDSITDDQVPEALDNLKQIFERMEPASPTEVFVRGRNPEVVKRILDIAGVEGVKGFVTPKTDPMEYPLYADPIRKHEGADFRMMPILEAKGMADPVFRADLYDVLSSRHYRWQIDALRIGVNDMMGYQGMRRADRDFTVYDSVVGGLVKDIVNEFRGKGDFTVTAPVFECFGEQYDSLFDREVSLHIFNELYGQTVIHPRHLSMLFERYKVRDTDLSSAANVLSEGAKAVEGNNGKMDEVTTHALWAGTVLMRAEMFGIQTNGLSGPSMELATKIEPPKELPAYRTQFMAPLKKFSLRLQP